MWDCLRSWFSLLLCSFVFGFVVKRRVVMLFLCLGKIVMVCNVLVKNCVLLYW